MADTPFLFMIYDFQNEVPLFAGSVVDQPEQQQPSNSETCKRLLRDFPTAYDNHKICSKVKEAGKFLDWLRANRNLCETSQDHYEAFTTNNCGGDWCGAAVSQVEQWKRDLEFCSGDKDQECKILE